MEFYRAYITVIVNDKVVKSVVKEGITPSKKTNAIRKAFYKGYQIASEGPCYIILIKREKEDKIIKQVGFFIAD